MHLCYLSAPLHVSDLASWHDHKVILHLTSEFEDQGQAHTLQYSPRHLLSGLEESLHSFTTHFHGLKSQPMSVEIKQKSYQNEQLDENEVNERLSLKRTHSFIQDEAVSFPASLFYICRVFIVVFILGKEMEISGSPSTPTDDLAKKGGGITAKRIVSSNPPPSHNK
jgi:hypothetical protein